MPGYTISSELEAINTMLGTIGEAPVNSLSGLLPADVAIAGNVLTETIKEVQLEGWHFNTEHNYTLKPAADGMIYVPPSVFRIILQDPDGRDLNIRGNRVYDKTAHTFRFENDITVSVCSLLPFEHMPEAFRWYVTIRASRRYQDRVVGSSEQHSFTKEDEYAARAIAVREDMESARPSMAKGEAATFIDGWTVGATLRR